MCGRFTRDFTWAEVHAFLSLFTLQVPAQEPEPAFNVAPTQGSWVIVPDGEALSAEAMRWGLIPSWSKDAKRAASAINARVETVAIKPSFRAAWKARRCLVPITGYYEWRLEGGIKQPYYVEVPQSKVVLLGGLWEAWKDPMGSVVRTFSIITQDATGPLTALHDRAPLFLQPEIVSDWLRGTPEQASAIALAAPLPELRWHAVGRAVSNSRSQGRGLIEPLDGSAAD